MATNSGWPEAFGFSMSYGRPCIVDWVEEGGSAEQSGLQIGDVLVEVDGEDVREWSIEEVIERAQLSFKVPPSILVKSHVKLFEIPKLRDVCGFGLTLRGDSPVYVRSVEFESPSDAAGVRSGDLILEVNGVNVRYSTKQEVLELIGSTNSVLELVVVVEALHSSIIRQKSKTEPKTDRIKSFQEKLNHYFQNDKDKRNQLLVLLNHYNTNCDIQSLARGLYMLLETPDDRKILPDIRKLIQTRDLKKFDMLLSYTPPALITQRSSPQIRHSPSNSRETCRLVQVHRGSNGEYGFSLSGNCPVFVRSVDTMSPVARAGINPDDFILEIDGINVRTATHSQVVQLLKESGPSPQLLVSLTPLAANESDEDYAVVSASLTEKMDEVLLKSERRSVRQSLTAYSEAKDLSRLVEDLCQILDDPQKAVVFHYICKLLPKESQAKFDQLVSSKSNIYYAVATKRQSTLRDTKIHVTTTDMSSRPLPPIPYNVSPLTVYSHHTGTVPHTHTYSTVPNVASILTVPTSTVPTVPIVPTVHTVPTVPSSTVPTVPSSTVHTVPTAKLSLADTLKKKSEKVKATSVPKVVSLSSTGSIPAPPPAPPPPPPPPLPMLSSGTTPPKFKRLHWNKVEEKEGTIWKELKLNEELEYSELDEQFAASEISNRRSITQQSKKATILDSRKAYNISILLGHLKSSPKTVKKAIMSCDTQFLSLERLQQMEKYAPDKKECSEYAQYAANPSVLNDPADRFSCEMSTIPHYRERLQSLIFQIHFSEKINEIQPDLYAIIEASNELRNSSKLKKIIEVVLNVGNYMTTNPISVRGFKIEFLQQLKDHKTNDRKSTLLHFLVKTINSKYPHVLDFAVDLKTVKAAARVSGETLELEVAELQDGLKELKRTLNSIDKDISSDNDQFITCMTPFVRKAEVDMMSLIKLYTKMKTEFTKTAKFFSEDETKTQIDDFFRIFATFIVDFERTLQSMRSKHEHQKQQEVRSSIHKSYVRDNDDATKCSSDILLAAANSLTPSNQDMVIDDKETFF